MRPKQVLLIGMGHAHLHLARHAGKFRRAGAELTAVSPSPFWYSGLATGMLGGEFPPEADQIDGARVLTKNGGTFIEDRLVALDPINNVARLASGAEHQYDLVSFNVGSEVNIPPIPGAAEHAWLVKPIARLWDLRQAIAHTPDRGALLRIVVVGGGATGCEIACNLHALCHRIGQNHEIRICAKSDRLLPAAPPRAARLISETLKKYGVTIALNVPVERITAGQVLCGGKAYASDYTIVASGLSAPSWLADINVALGPKSGLAVNEFLRCPDAPQVYGAGDCIDFIPRPLPKLGVFGVRQAPVLTHNLLAVLEGRPLKAYKPQRRYLSILNLGDGNGLAIWNGFTLQGKTAGLAKRWLDTRWLGQYRAHCAN